MRKEENRAAFKRNVGRALPALLVCAVAGAVIIGCKSTGSDDSPPEGFRITKFMIEETEGVINQTDRTIEVVMPYGTVIEEFVPTVEFIGAKINPVAGTIVDFTEQPVKYTVYSKDGSAFSYLVTVTVEIPNTKEILSFELEGVVTANPASITDVGEDSGIINLAVPYGTNVSNRTAVIEHSGDSVDPVAGKPQDFRNTAIYTVYSLQGERRTYMVNVSIAPNTEALITRFTINSAEGDIDGTDIEVWVPFGTNLSRLTPVIEMSAGSTVNPTGEQDFSNGAVTYRVKAADNTTITNYTVTVKVSPNTAKEITSFTIAGQQGTTDINGTDITVTLPANMPKNPLTPTIVFTGNSVTPASGVAQNFSSPITYTVKAADNSTKIYTVTVTNAAATAVTFKSVTANGASWATETTLLTLSFSADMGDALKAEHITLSGTITKGALTAQGAGVYELAVSNIPDNDVSVNVTAAANSVYGFTITGSPQTTKVYKSPVEVDWSVTADGANGTQTTNKLTFTFDKDVALTLADITLTGAGAVKGTVTGSGTTRTLTISGVNANNVDLIVSLEKAGFAFKQASKTVKVYKQLSTDAGLSSLTVDGFTLDPAFDTNTTVYKVTVSSEIIHITAVANDTNSRMFYVENDEATVDSGEPFNSKPLKLEIESTITILVKAENGTTTKSYTLLAKYSDFSGGTVDPFTVSNTAEWNTAVNIITGGGNNKSYDINVIGNFDAASSPSATFGNSTGITVLIRGSKTITLSNTGVLIHVGANQSVILRDITLKGRTDNSNSLVDVETGSEFEMRGSAKITGNAGGTSGGGVFVYENGTFTMRDNASVSGNTTDSGSGVYTGGTFTMWDNASVSGNTAGASGGGVYVGGGTFTMWDNASVSGNTAGGSGGGVYMSFGEKTFTMRDNASVSGNTAKGDNGGGVSVGDGTFIMRDNASVSGNTIDTTGSDIEAYGGGVFVADSGLFRMAGGTVYGSNAASGFKNTAGSGAAMANMGMAEYGIFNADGTWLKNDDLNWTNNTIKVVNGVLQP